MSQASKSVNAQKSKISVRIAEVQGDTRFPNKIQNTVFLVMPAKDNDVERYPMWCAMRHHYTGDVPKFVMETPLGSNNTATIDVVVDEITGEILSIVE